MLEPHDERLKADSGYAYCLADAGKTNVIYVAGSKGANLKLDSGQYSLTRYDPRTGQSMQLPAPAAGMVQLVPPDTQDWVFIVKAN